MKEFDDLGMRNKEQSVRLAVRGIAPGDDITLETRDNQKPAVLKSDEHPEFLYLLMPVRIS